MSIPQNTDRSAWCHNKDSSSHCQRMRGILSLCKWGLNWHSSRNHEQTQVASRMSPHLLSIVASLPALCLPSDPTPSQCFINVLKANVGHVRCMLPPGSKPHWSTEMFLLLKGSVTMRQLTTPGPKSQRGSPHSALLIHLPPLLWGSCSQSWGSSPCYP